MFFLVLLSAKASCVDTEAGHPASPGEYREWHCSQEIPPHFAERVNVLDDLIQACTPFGAGDPYAPHGLDKDIALVTGG